MAVLINTRYQISDLSYVVIVVHTPTRQRATLLLLHSVLGEEGTFEAA